MLYRLGELSLLPHDAVAHCSGNEIGPFKAIEESTLAQLTLPEDRSTIFAWYAVLSGLAASFGSLSAGKLVQYLLDKKKMDPIPAYRWIFYLYTLCGLIKSLFSVVLSSKCEPSRSISDTRAAADERTRLLVAEQGDESTRDQVEGDLVKPKKPGFIDRVLGLTPETRKKVYTLSLLFGLDNLASGLVPL